MVAKAETDASGNARVAYKLDASHVLVARNGADVSLLPFNQPALDMSEFAVAGRTQAWFDVFAWSGRDLYRPGETVRLSALMRDHDGRAVKAQPLFLSLKQPDGKVFLNPARARRGRLLRLEPGAAGRRAYRPLAGRVPHRARRRRSGAGHVAAHRGIPARAHETGAVQRAGHAAARREAHARCRRGLPLWRTGRGQSLHRPPGGRRRPASGGKTPRPLFRRPDRGPAERRQGRGGRSAGRKRPPAHADRPARGNLRDRCAGGGGGHRQCL